MFAWYWAEHCSAVQCSAVQYNTKQYRAMYKSGPGEWSPHSGGIQESVVRQAVDGQLHRKNSQEDSGEFGRIHKNPGEFRIRQKLVYSSTD